MTGRLSIRLSTLLVATVALVVAGYPLAGILSVLLDVEGRSLSIGFRAVVCLLALLTVVGAIGAKVRFSMPQLLVAFLFLYAVRVLWDAATGVPRADEASMFLLATVLTPAVAAMTAAPVWDDRRAAWAVFWIGTTTLALILFVQTTGYGAWRSRTLATGRLSFDNLNPISIGHLATSTLLAALCRLDVRGLGKRVAVVAGGALAVVSLAMAASRGPLVAAVATVGLYLYLRRRWGWLAALSLGGAAFVAVKLDTILRAFRLTDLHADLSARERLYIQRNALEQFVDRPLAGSAYVDLITLQYPHNLVIEAAMALGVVGLALSLAICLSGGWIATRGTPAMPPFLSLLFVQFLVAVQFSGAVWSSGGFWTVAALLFAAHARRTAAAGRLRRLLRRFALSPAAAPARRRAA